MKTLYDMHSHLDFASNAQTVAREAEDMAISTMSSTVTPASYVSAKEKFADFENIYVCLGLHPWWVADNRIGQADIDRFKKLIFETNLIGEVGLDFSKSHKPSIQKQTEAFAEVLNALKAAENEKLVYLHSVRSATPILDMLDKYGMIGADTFVFHWFNGTHEEFGRALSLGAFFSVGMKMLATEKGRVYAKAIPDDRLLLESDNPQHEGMQWDASTWKQELDNTLFDLAELRGVEKEDLLSSINDNSKKLIDKFV